MLFAVTALLALFFSLSSCKGDAKMPEERLSRALDAELTVTTDALSYRVAVHLGAQTEDGERDGEVVFLSPASLSGLTVRRTDGAYTVEREGLLSPRGETGDLFLPALLLSPAEVVGRKRTVENQRAVTLLYSADGRTLCFDVETGALVRVEREDCSATIEWIEVR